MPPPPPPVAAPQAGARGSAWSSKGSRKARKCSRAEVARKAVTEIKKTPPKLFAYSIAGALSVILLIVGMIAWHIHSENSADDGGTEQPVAASATLERHPEAGVEYGAAAGTSAAEPAATPERISAGHEPAAVSVVPKYSHKKIKAAPVVRAGRDPWTADHQLNS